jgi:hypothetical protein
MVLLAGINALLKESTRETAQRRAEQGIHAAMQKASNVLPGGATSRELTSQVERTLQEILAEALNALFAERARATAQQHAESVSHELVQRNVSGAVGQTKNLLQDLVQEIVAVLRNQWQRLLRLLLRVIMAALDDSLSPPEKETPRVEQTPRSKKKA